MVTICPHCYRALSSAETDVQPTFCMHCGQKLDTSLPPPVDTQTQFFTPETDEGQSGELDDTPKCPELAPQEVGGYRLLKRLGAGGMGIVYEAESSDTGSRVAVKILSSRLASDPISVERFRQEGRLASQLTHPRCVFVLSADTDRGRPYIVMELMPGRTLKDIIDERGPMTPDEAVARVLDVIDGLREAHRVGMIHRDVKPSNCFLTVDDRVKIGDFGLSKSLARGTSGNHLTRTGAFLGTVLFASPEQIRGEPLDYGSDVYSVAATLYYLLSGEAPYHHPNSTTALAKALSDPLPRIRAKRPDVSAQLERIILKGLDRDRSRRWHTLDDFRDALIELLPEQHRPAQLRVLFAAYLLDRCAVGLITTPMEWFLLKGTGFGITTFYLFEFRWLSISFMLAYFAIAEGLIGTTLGKWVFGLRVSHAKQTGPPGVGRAILRTVAFHAILGVMFFVPGVLIRQFGITGVALGFVVIVAGAVALLVQARERWGFRGLHDFASGCRVTRKPLRTRKLRLAIRRPTPLDTLLPPPADGLPETVVGFFVNGRLSVDSNGEQVWLAEDRALGRSVLLWLRPSGGGALGVDSSRLSRLRRLGNGTTAWGEIAYDWAAYSAPIGGPLAEAVGPGSRLSWIDARHLIEQLVEEFRAAEADGSVPPRLALDHIWIETNGRVQVLDFPLCAAHYQPKAPLGVLRDAVSLTLEGQPRSSSSPVAAPLPAHAMKVLNRLFTTEPPLAQFQRELAVTHAYPPEVTSDMRLLHLAIQAPLLLLPLVFMFTYGFVVMLFMAVIAAMEVNYAERAAAILTNPEERATLATSTNEGLQSAIDNPRTKDRVNDLVERTRAEADMRRAHLFLPQRIYLEQYNRLAIRVSDTNADADAVKDVLMWAGASDESAEHRLRSQWTLVMLPGVECFLCVPIGLLLLAALLRGGLSMRLAFMAVVRADGRPAYRRQCAVRAAVVWLPIAFLLGGSIALQIHAPNLMNLAAAMWLAAATLLPIYAIIALRYPARAPQDRIAGTYLVPL